MSRSKWLPSSCVLLVAGSLLAADEMPKDFTKATLKSLGIETVKPAKDKKTGFVVGGTNATELIVGLKEINKLSIEALEKSMRPGELSVAGFLGKDERLLDIMAEDNRYVVEKRGLTHQELARHLHLIGAVAVKYSARQSQDITYRGRKFRVSAIRFKGFQESPFEDGTKASCDATVTNLANGKTIRYSLLVPYTIERYGFYEGKGTRYRVDPAQVIEVFDFLVPAKAK
jgi:hypothetical protein